MYDFVSSAFLAHRKVRPQRALHGRVVWWERKNAATWRHPNHKQRRRKHLLQGGSGSGAGSRGSGSGDFTKAAPKGRVEVELSSEPSSAEEEEPSSATEGTPVEEEPAGKKGVEKEKKGPPEPKRERGREVDKRSDKGRSEKGRAEKGGSEKGRWEKGRGKSKGKSQWEQGRRACPICWQMVVNTKADMEQHQYWSVPCNAWRRHAKGRPWDDAVESAEKQKDRRTARWNASHGNPGGAASGSKPAAAKKPEKKAEKKKKKVPAREKGKASSTKKDKEEKRKRKSSSPEPRPVKKEKKRKDTSSEEEDKGSGRGKGWTKVWHWVKLWSWLRSGSRLRPESHPIRWLRSASRLRPESPKSFCGRIACGPKADGCGPAGKRILEKPTGFCFCTARRSAGPG